MHLPLWIIVFGIPALLLIGYGIRGLVHRELVATKTEVFCWIQSLEKALAKDAANAKSDVAALVRELRAKLKGEFEKL